MTFRNLSSHKYSVTDLVCAGVTAMLGEFILNAILGIYSKPTKADLERQIILLESKIITRHIELNDEVILA